MTRAEGMLMWGVMWIIVLIIYGHASESDRQTDVDLTAEVDRVAVTEGRQ